MTIKFLAFQAELTGRLMQTAADFAEEKGLTFDAGSFARQGTSDVPHLSTEILTFGADFWPTFEPILQAA